MRRTLHVLAAAVSGAITLSLAGFFVFSAVAHASAGHAAPRYAYGARNVSPGAAVHTAVTTIILRPDSGYNGYWAYDSITRTVTITRHARVSGTFCGLPAAHACYAYTFTLADAGNFQTITGQVSPGVPATALHAAEIGDMSGSGSGSFYDTYRTANVADVPTFENDNGNLPTGLHTTSLWALQFFNGAGFPHSVRMPVWDWEYGIDAGDNAVCPSYAYGHWSDAWNVPAGLSGNILAPDAADCGL